MIKNTLVTNKYVKMFLCPLKRNKIETKHNQPILRNVKIQSILYNKIALFRVNLNKPTTSLSIPIVN